MSNKQHYDYTCSTFNPNGKIFQVEYAQAAANFGSICLGLKNKTHAVLVSLKRSQNELSGYQDKIFKIDDNMGMALAGLTADARLLCKYMRNECLNHRYVYQTEFPLQRMVEKISTKAQKKTQTYFNRPYGVSLLIAGHDQAGPHIFLTDPSGNYNEFEAYSIGARCQTARTYFEDVVSELQETSLDELILHGLKALQKASSEDDKLTKQNVEISVIGKNQSFKKFEENELEQWINKLGQQGGDKMEEEN
ncbi:hypothetical protein PPERSA_06498 [Pseudocohnilembus persalinus]|uniref:Proteasome alpha-type subunits domain-containing protein n=1 Tax=Pseudocohnilembus persalinus TaxID=266149 RepID=A0A0V0QS91_PSEPJ|nr:hypothetical protein PPERSA_06498 [Pseudocohnilembus persalinus]|eukprot:KRX04864.1 hypothetical protein PPERSA_06498 [Pseudocohnilembus persalinus]